MKRALSLASALLGLTVVAAPASALPLDRGVSARSFIADVAYGCRRGFAPGPYGRCRPIYRHHRAYGRPDMRPAPMWRQNLRAPPAAPMSAPRRA